MRVIPWGDQITMSTVTSGPFVTFGAPLTIGLWVWQNYVPGPSSIQEWMRMGSERAVLRYQDNFLGSNVQFYVRNSDGTYNIFTDGAISKRTWTHVLGRYDLTNLRVYLNGVYAGSQQANTKASYSVASDYVFFGSTTEQFDGAVAEAAIWSAALTDDEIAVLGKGAKPIDVRARSLVYYVPFLSSPIVNHAYIPEPELSGTGSTGSPVYSIPRNSGAASTPPVDWAPGPFLGIPPT